MLVLLSTAFSITMDRLFVTIFQLAWYNFSIDAINNGTCSVNIHACWEKFLHASEKCIVGSMKNIPPCINIVPTCIEIVSMTVQNLPALMFLYH